MRNKYRCFRRQGPSEQRSRTRKSGNQGKELQLGRGVERRSLARLEATRPHFLSFRDGALGAGPNLALPGVPLETLEKALGLHFISKMVLTCLDN